MPETKQGFYYEKHGDAGPCLLLIAGLGSDSRYWNGLVKRLQEHYQVYIFDNRDSGRSTQVEENYLVGDMANDVIGLMDELRIDSAHVLGHSMGGAIAQHLVLSAPEKIKTLVLSATFLQASALTKHAIEIGKVLRPQVDARAWMMMALPWSYTRNFFEDQKNINDAVASAIDDPYPQSEAAYLRQAHACLNHDLRGKLHGVTVPCLVITGETDMLATPDEAKDIATEISNARLYVIPEAAHAAPNEHLNAYAEQLEQFWQEHA